MRPTTEIIRKFYEIPKGIDLRSSDMTLPMERARMMGNADFERTPAGDILTNRRGWEAVVNTRHYNDAYAGSTTAFYHWGFLGTYSGDRIIQIVKYNRTEIGTGSLIEEPLVIGSYLYYLHPTPITFAYLGAGNAKISIIVESGVKKCKIWQGATLVLDQALSSPLAISGAYSLEDLKTDVEAIGGGGVFTMTIGNGHFAYVVGNHANRMVIAADDGAGGAHNLAVGDQVRYYDSTLGYEVARRITHVDAAGTLFGVGWMKNYINATDNTKVDLAINSFSAGMLPQVIEQVFTVAVPYQAEILEPYHIHHPNYMSTPGPFYNGFIIANYRQGRNFSYENIKNCIYFATPAADISLLKYDGQRVYKAGLPVPGIPTTTRTGAGAVDAGIHNYIYTWVFTDAQNNEIESVPSPVRTIDITAAGAGTITVASPTLADFTPSSQYCVNFGYASAAIGGAGSNTISLLGVGGANSDHGLMVGDKVMFYDLTSAAFVERTVVSATYYDATANGTITIDGAAITIALNSPITARLRMRVYRTKVGGSDYYYVGEQIPSLQTPTCVFTDNIADVNLGYKFFEPEENEKHSPPPENPCFLTSFQGGLVLGGSRDEPNTCFPSVPGGPEYYPENLQFDVGSNNNDLISGLGVSGETLVVGKEDSIFAVTGTILDLVSLTPQFRVDQLSSGIGIVSHRSIAVDKTSLFFCSKAGPYVIINGQSPIPLSSEWSDISSYFDMNRASLGTAKFIVERAVGFYHSIERKYMLCIPTPDPTNSDPFYSFSGPPYTLVFDVDRQAWLQWGNYNFCGGMILLGESMMFLHTEYQYKTGRYGPFVCRGFFNQYNDTTMLDYSRIDFLDYIYFTLNTGEETLGEPSLNKRFMSLEVYAPLIYSYLFNRTTTDYLTMTAGKPNFSLATIAYRNFRDLLIGGRIAGAKTLVFSPTLGVRQMLKFIGALKSQAIRLEFKSVNLDPYYKIMLIGWELVIRTPIRKRVWRKE